MANISISSAASQLLRKSGIGSDKLPTVIRKILTHKTISLLIQSALACFVIQVYFLQPFSFSNDLFFASPYFNRPVQLIGILATAYYFLTTDLKSGLKAFLVCTVLSVCAYYAITLTYKPTSVFYEWSMPFFLLGPILLLKKYPKAILNISWFIFACLSAVVLVTVVLKIHPNAKIFINYNQNRIFMFYAICTLPLLFFEMRNKKADNFIIPMLFFTGVWSGGRTNVTIATILLLHWLFKKGISYPKKILIVAITIGTLAIAGKPTGFDQKRAIVYENYSDYVNATTSTPYESSLALSYATSRGLFESSRWSFWQHYAHCLTIHNFIFGSVQVSQGFLNHNNHVNIREKLFNWHNSFIQTHYQGGIIPVLFLILFSLYVYRELGIFSRASLPFTIMLLFSLQNSYVGYRFSAIMFFLIPLCMIHTKKSQEESKNLNVQV